MIKILPGIVLLAILSCSNRDEGADNGNNKSASPHSNAEKYIDTSVKVIRLDGCYQMTIKRDTANMKLNIVNSTVTGDLVYDWNEKDGNAGTLKGVLRDSLIFADYSFQSEGMTSVREVIFKIKDDSLQWGYGNITEKEGKIIFRDRDKIQFDSNSPFIKIPCTAQN